jgi:type I restriction enzyme S subunit
VLEAELQTELNIRKNQYEYYRNKLLSFSDEIKWTTIKEICSVERGKVYSKVYLSEHP